MHNPLMLKLAATLTCALTLAAPISAVAETVPTLQSNGFKMNGIKWNGLRTNGFKMNGIKFNGVQFNGPIFQGLRVNGLCTQERSETRPFDAVLASTGERQTSFVLSEVRVIANGAAR